MLLKYTIFRVQLKETLTSRRFLLNDNTNNNNNNECNGIKTCKRIDSRSAGEIPGRCPSRDFRNRDEYFPRFDATFYAEIKDSFYLVIGLSRIRPFVLILGSLHCL